MEYMEYPLREIINQRENYFRKSKGMQQISHLVYQLFCGIQYLHKAEITHGVSFLSSTNSLKGHRKII